MRVEKYIVKKGKDESMRDFFVIIGILSLIIGGSIWTHSFYESTRNQIDKKLEILSSNIGRG
jgi:prolipoprotein diacylglyceryltransferase